MRCPKSYRSLEVFLFITALFHIPNPSTILHLQFSEHILLQGKECNRISAQGTSLRASWVPCLTTNDNVSSSLCSRWKMVLQRHQLIICETYRCYLYTKSLQMWLQQGFWGVEILLDFLGVPWVSSHMSLKEGDSTKKVQGRGWSEIFTSQRWPTGSSSRKTAKKLRDSQAL